MGGSTVLPKGENSIAVCGFDCTNGPGKQSSYLTRSPCSVQVLFNSYSWLALPKQLDHKCAQNDRLQSYLQPGAGKP